MQAVYLHYLRSLMREVGLQLIFALVPSTVNCYLSFARQILLATLRGYLASGITWLDDDKLDEMINLMQVANMMSTHQSFHVTEPPLWQARHPRLVGVVGTLDGLKLPVEVSSDSCIENATYNGWLHSHFVLNVIAFAPTGLVLWHSTNKLYTEALHRQDHPCSIKHPWKLAWLQGCTPAVRCVVREIANWVLPSHWHHIPMGCRSMSWEDMHPSSGWCKLTRWSGWTFPSSCIQLPTPFILTICGMGDAHSTGWI